MLSVIYQSKKMKMVRLKGTGEGIPTLSGLSYSL